MIIFRPNHLSISLIGINVGWEKDSSCFSSALSFVGVAFPVDTASFNVEHNTIDVRIFTVAIKNYMKLHTC